MSINKHIQLINCKLGNREGCKNPLSLQAANRLTPKNVCTCIIRKNPLNSIYK